MANNKRRLIAALAFNKLADILASAKTTLPALLITLGAPAWMIAWLVPIRESGALLPQVLISAYLRKQRSRHNVWRLGMAVQIAAVCSILAAAFISPPVAAGAVVIAALVLLSLGRSACSLTVKDIQADVAQKGERGRLVGMASTASGLMTLGIAVPLSYFKPEQQEYAVYGLIAAAALAFIITLVCLWPQKTYVDSDTSEAKGLLHWRFDRTVYTFVFVRGLYVHTALVAPYFMLESGEDAKALLPMYLAAQATATLLSSFLWGAVADKSARLTLQIAGAIALSACVGLLTFSQHSLWLSSGLFLLLSIAHAGVRTGRQTYSLDVKEGQDRTELVGFSNTAIGVILLGFGSLYAVISSFINFSVVYVMTTMLVVAIAATLLLPKEK